MLLKAMDKFQVAKREYSEAKKAQYTDKGDVKNYFRASELGMGDRKIMYGFFKHQIPTVPKSAKNLRQLENGDKVHERYQTAWEDMGALISMEERLSSKNDEYLAQFPWEWAGHYDGLLDINVLRAHATDKCVVDMVKNEETGVYEMEVTIDDAYADKIGIFAEDYEPLAMVADIKTMNPWGFKRLKNKDVAEIQGYIDQISFYMYMLNTPYGSIFVEDKGSNELVEVQIVWSDLHEDVEYTFDPEIHGELEDNIVRVVINNERFFGSEKVVGLVPRLSHLWEIKTKLEELDGNNADFSEFVAVMPLRCSEAPNKFPCSWGDGKEKCEFFEHCWNEQTKGVTVRPYEACPAECVWEIIDKATGDVTKVDSRKVPEDISVKAFQALCDMGALDLGQFLVDEVTALPALEAEETALNVDSIMGANGELNLGAPPAAPQSSEALEYQTEDGKKAIKCLNCGKEITYTRLANGGTKKCPFCDHTNKVIK